MLTSYCYSNGVEKPLAWRRLQQTPLLDTDALTMYNEVAGTEP